MNTELMEALNVLEKEKNIRKEVVLKAIEESLVQACKHHFGKSDNIVVNMDYNTGEYEINMAKEAGVQRIRIHDIRHSHVSHLIDMGFSATAIADRVGHESIDITYNYAHLFPSKQTEMADKLNMERGN